MNRITKHFFHLMKKINEDDILPWASMLTIYLLLSIFPLMMILTEALSRFSLNNPELLAYWTDLLPPNIYSTLTSISEELVMRQSPTVIPTAALITLWSASRGILAIIKALNKAYGINEGRGYIRLRLLAFTYTLGLILLILLSLITIVFGNKILTLVTQKLTVPEQIEQIIGYLRYAVTLLFSLMFFIGLYNVCPSKKSGFHQVLPGAILATIGLTITSIGFSLYISYLGNLSYLYGSLSGFIVVILWLFVVSVLIMVGGEVNAIYFYSLGNKHSK